MAIEKPKEIVKLFLGSKSKNNRRSILIFSSYDSFISANPITQYFRKASAGSVDRLGVGQLFAVIGFVGWLFAFGLDLFFLLFSRNSKTLSGQYFAGHRGLL